MFLEFSCLSPSWMDDGGDTWQNLQCNFILSCSSVWKHEKQSLTSSPFLSTLQAVHHSPSKWTMEATDWFGKDLSVAVTLLYLDIYKAFTHVIYLPLLSIYFFFNFSQWTRWVERQNLQWGFPLFLFCLNLREISTSVTWFPPLRCIHSLSYAASGVSKFSLNTQWTWRSGEARTTIQPSSFILFGQLWGVHLNNLLPLCLIWFPSLFIPHNGLDGLLCRNLQSVFKLLLYLDI